MKLEFSEKSDYNMECTDIEVTKNYVWKLICVVVSYLYNYSCIIIIVQNKQKHSHTTHSDDYLLFLMLLVSNKTKKTRTQQNTPKCKIFHRFQCSEQQKRYGIFMLMMLSSNRHPG